MIRAFPVMAAMLAAGCCCFLFQGAPDAGDRLELERVPAAAAANIRKYYGDSSVPAFAKEAEAKVQEQVTK
jgi:hypothetical protein